MNDSKSMSSKNDFVFRNDCQEIRPIISRMKMLEAREGQRSQMKENAMKLESDRELENFWHKLMLKDVELKVSKLI